MGGNERTVDFRNTRRSHLALCEDCVQDFERDETVLEVRSPTAL